MAIREDFSPTFLPIIDLIGIENAEKLWRAYSQKFIYIPDVSRLDRSIRNRKIRSEYARGDTTAQALADEHGISERHVWRILDGTIRE